METLDSLQLLIEDVRFRTSQMKETLFAGEKGGVLLYSYLFSVRIQSLGVN